MKNKMMATLEIVVVLCSVLLVALPVTTIAAEQDDYVLGVYGNANEDDTIDMRDLTYVKLIFFGKKPETELADAKYDGEINPLDFIQIKLIIVGKEKKLTLVDLADRTVTINKPVEKMVVGGGNAYFQDIIPVYGDKKDPFKIIVGWASDFKTYRKGIYEKYKEKFPEIDDIPDVGSMWQGTFNVEKIITLKPDVVIMASMYCERAETVIKQLEAAGIPIVFIDYRGAETRQRAAKSTIMLGYMLDKEERAQEIVDFYTEQIDKVYSRMDEIEDKPKPKVYIEGGHKRWSAYAPDKSLGEVADELGVINIAEKGTKTINPEQVLDANPDIIMITGSYWSESAGYPAGLMRLGYYANPAESRELLKQQLDRPGWDTLNAVKNNRVYSIHHGAIANIYNFFVDQYFAKCFYPDVFEDLDPEENWKEFHERFLPVDYSGVWMLSLEE